MHHKNVTEQRNSQNPPQLNWPQFLEIISQMRFEKLLYQMQEVLDNKSNITIVEDGSPKKRINGITMNQAQLIGYIFT